MFTIEEMNEKLNKIHCMDCLEFMDRLIEQGVTVDAIITDPPYNTTACHWDKLIPFDEMWKRLNKLIKPNGAIVLTSQGIFTAKLILSNEKYFKYKIVWEKSKPTNFLNAKKQPLRKHEDICVFYQKQPIYNPQMQEGLAYNKGTRKNQLTGSYGEFKPVEVKSSGERYPTDIVYFKTSESEGEVYHPTQKPVQLMEYLIKTYTNENETVLDFTCGSGSTLVACKNTRRNFYACELEPDYVAIANKRLEAVQGSLF